MKLRKVMALTLAGAMTATTLTACGGDGGANTTDDDTSSDALHDNHIFVVESIKLLFQLSAASAFYFVTGRQENFINRHIK